MINFTPSNIGLFKQAFYHRSSNNNNSKAQQNNERLEFLGDAILSSVVAEYLYRKYPGSDEGFLTKMRSKIVKRQT
ncbi:MAG: ribonuclease III domain-containing protein, partial [Saprospiraceae bacterium]